MNADSAVLFANISCYGSRVRQGFLHAILKTNGVESVSVTGMGSNVHFRQAQMYV